jgi:hypothetical protein
MQMMQNDNFPLTIQTATATNVITASTFYRSASLFTAAPAPGGRLGGLKL